jgi:hypothetical protein
MAHRLQEASDIRVRASSGLRRWLDCLGPWPSEMPFMFFQKWGGEVSSGIPDYPSLIRQRSVCSLGQLSAPDRRLMTRSSGGRCISLYRAAYGRVGVLIGFMILVTVLISGVSYEERLLDARFGKRTGAMSHDGSDHGVIRNRSRHRRKAVKGERLWTERASHRARRAHRMAHTPPSARR